VAKPFRFGVHYRAGSGKDWRDLARRVEDLGDHSLHTSDHNVGPGPAMGEPATVRSPSRRSLPSQWPAKPPAPCTWAAGCFASATVRRSFWPKRLPSACLAEGRIEVGLGAGWLQAEYHAMGLTFCRPERAFRRWRSSSSC
jgi:alkanesulfonate monooxygenase SsuD/methylene tetrahydromethanopterin reductase-like flavin-dependent oxidoreductase (luciferase family)